MRYQGFVALVGRYGSPMANDRDGNVHLMWSKKVRGTRKEALADAATLKDAHEKKYSRIIRDYFSTIDIGLVRVLPGMRYPLPLWRDSIRKQLLEADRIAASEGRNTSTGKR